MRQIKAQVTGQFVRLSSKYAGVQGEGNVTQMRFVFDESWSGYGKRVVWRDARGLEPTAQLLTAELRTGESLLDYTVTIPPEPLSRPGWCTFTVEGFSEENGEVTVMLTVSERLEVRPGACETPAEPTQNQALQLQQEIDGLIAAVDGRAAAAQESAENAADSAGTAASCAIQALTASQLSRSWAVGGTGLRNNEDTVNAMAYALRAEAAAASAEEHTATPDAHMQNYQNPHRVSKAQVGLGSVDNTADLDKPVSTAVQLALNAKAAASHTHAASAVGAGTLAGAVQANAAAQAALATPMVRSISIGTSDLTPGESPLATGTVYLVYEEEE